MNHIILPRDETLFLEFAEQRKPIVYEYFFTKYSFDNAQA